MNGLNTCEVPYLTHDCKAVRGCSPCSEACDNCWAAAGAWRMLHNPNPKISGPFQGLVEMGPNGKPRFTGVIRTNDNALGAVLRKRKPSVIGMCFGGDLFHPKVPRPFIDKAMAVMGIRSDMVFIVPTKRIGFMAEYLAAMPDLSEARKALGGGLETGLGLCAWKHAGYPNVIFMGTVWDQKSLDLAAHWFKTAYSYVEHLAISYESALGPLTIPEALLKRLAWVVCGCEQLPGGRPGRPMDEEWPFLVKGLCEDAGVPFYLKQIVPAGEDKVRHDPVKFKDEVPELLWPFFEFLEFPEGMEVPF